MTELINYSSQCVTTSAVVVKNNKFAVSVEIIALTLLNWNSDSTIDDW